MNLSRFTETLPRPAFDERAALEKADMQREFDKEPRVITDAPALVDLKLEYRQLDERHEVVKAWPPSVAREAELERVCKRKAEIALEVAKL